MNEKLEKHGITLGPDGTATSRLVMNMAFAGFATSGSKAKPASKDELDYTPNFQPETREELEPGEEDFIYPVFRAISQIMIPDRPLDLSKPGVLENSIPMMISQTVYPNHWVDIEGWLGAVEEAWWDDPKKSGTKFSAPGINARYKIDWKANPKVARGLLMEPPAIHSTSIGFCFDWEKSHPELDDRQFWSLLGEEVDDEIVRLIVTEILCYYEVSLVFQGGDPEAKRVVENSKLANQQPPAGGATETLSGGERMDDLQKLMAELKVSSVPEALAKISELANRPEPDAALLELGKQLEAKDINVSEALVLAEVGKSYREQLAEDLGKFAGLALCGENETLPEGFVESHSAGSIEQLKANVDLYRNKALECMPSICLDCGSHNVQGRSSVDESLDELDQEDQPGGKLTDSGFKESLRSMHGS